MSRLSPLKFAKSALASAFIGGTVGIAVKTWRRDNERAKQLLTYAAAAGVSGLAVGYVFATFKRCSVYTHSLSFGGNFFVMSATFLIYRDGILVQFGKGGKQLYANHLQESNVHVLLARHPVSPMFASAASGGLTGLVLSTIFWYGPKVLLTNSIQGVGLGVLGQFVYNKYHAWRLQKVLQYNFPELTSYGSPIQGEEDLEENIHWSESLKGFLSRRTHSSQVNEQIRNLEIQLDLLDEEEKRLHSQTSNKENEQ